MAGFLGAPKHEDELYLARGEEAGPYRPVLQGDVFGSIGIPGVETPHGHVMIVGHPCSLRAGPVLKPRLQMIPVVPHDGLPFERWADGHYGVFPLPNLELDGRHYAASFEETGMVSRDELTVGRRVACLTEPGILWFQQRYVHYLTRVAVQPIQLGEVSAPVLVEAELLEEWNCEFVKGRTEAGEDLDDALREEAAAFDEFIRSSAGNAESLQAQLRDPVRRSDVRRTVRHEIRRRADTFGQDGDLSGPDTELTSA
jgi:hypothetical protein